jgi:UDPglucose 6-dehydrogenase
MKPRSTKPRVAFVGLGYVGLSTAVCLASRGFPVLGIDIDQKKLDVIRRGEIPFHEQGLPSLLRQCVRMKSLSLSSSYRPLRSSEYIFITVGTPGRRDGAVDTSFVESSAGEIGRNLGEIGGKPVVVVKSTVIPGTTLELVLPILEKESGKKAGTDFGLAVNPEFLHEGSAVKETFHPDALVVGGFDRDSTESVVRFYREFYGRLPKTIRTSPANAELMKYAINSGRAVQLSFVNTVANVCSKVPGGDMDDVAKGLKVVAGMDERYLGAGLGFGGSCLSKDSRAFSSFARLVGVDEALVSAALVVNLHQTDRAVGMAESLCGPLEGKKVAVLGLAFKANTDDIRESVSISLVKSLLSKHAEVSVYDPRAMSNAREVLGDGVRYANSAKDCLKGSECCFIATGWKDFRRLGPKDFKSLMASPVVVDGRRIYDQGPFLRSGIRMLTIGTGPVPRHRQ